MLVINLPDGKTLEFSGVVCARDVAQEIGPGLAKASLAAKVDGRLVSLEEPLPEEGSVALELITKKSPEALEILRHSAAHIMARAVMRLFPGVELAFGPAVENGFYYDFAMEHSLSESDFRAIEAEMEKIIKEDEPFEKITKSRDEAIKILADMGQNLKVEHLQSGLEDQEFVSFYRQGEFLDLCRGPHVPSAKWIGAFCLTSVAGAYWKGDAQNQQLQRLYATAFFDKKELKEYLTLLEEAKKRDHRLLGRQLELFAIDQRVGSGLVLWLPKGAIIRRQLENFLYDELMKRGYQVVYSPVVGRVGLYMTSGHYPYYADSQFPPIEVDKDDLYLLRPMNCPHHVTIYQNRPRSYRELPLRIAEFGNVYRFEQSGELNGLTRVRGFTQDDAHIFCTEEQVSEEFKNCIEMTQFVLNMLGFDNYRVRLGFRDPASDKYVGAPEVWDKAEHALESACAELQLPNVTIARGEAAFYGPKADFVVSDCIGRDWQLGTVQLDYNLPSAERFDLSYVGADNQLHRPVMIHRAPFGSFERFIGILIEHFAGAFPMWLAPEQVRILVVSQKYEEYARKVEKRLREAGFRVSGDYRSEKIGAKIREAQLQLIPYMLIIGQREEEEGNVSVRDRIEGDLGSMPLAQAIEKFAIEVREKTIKRRAAQD
ncbi:MAG: threonine--tRNA ligase [Planctomycetia bacterium]|nr:threonine--tRNA ligase [Planctomycetia bacterium]